MEQQQLSSKEKAYQDHISDLNASCVHLRTMIFEYQDKITQLEQELEQFKQDNARLEKQNQ